MQSKCLATRLPCRILYRRHNGKKVIHKTRETQTDKSDYSRTRRADHGTGQSVLFHISAGMFRNYLRRLRHLINSVKSALEKCCKYIINVIKIVELTVKRRCRKSDLVFISVKILKLIVRSLLCLIRTKSDALTAIDTLFFLNYRVSIANSYRFGGTSFYTVGTAFTFG